MHRVARGPIVAVGMAVILAGAGSGCGSTSTTRATPTTVPAPDPQPRTLDVVGDSINAQSYWGHDAEWLAAGVGAPSGFDVVKNGFLGNRIQEAQPWVTAETHDPDHPRPQILVVALGAANASLAFGQPGWTHGDGDAFRTLINTPSPRTCVVVVLPAAASTAPAPVRAQFAVMRPALQRIAAARARTVVVDWNDELLTHPGYAGPEGVHLAADHALPGQQADPEAADAFAALLWSGARRCRR